VGSAPASASVKAMAVAYGGVSFAFLGGALNVPKIVNNISFHLCNDTSITAGHQMMIKQ
jgi:hypothetical protein